MPKIARYDRITKISLLKRIIDKKQKEIFSEEEIKAIQSITNKK